MALLLLGLVLFLGIHSASIVAPAARDRAVARLGEGPWKGLYSLVALAGLGLIVVGYGAARQAPAMLWSPPTFTRHLALLLLLPVFPMLLAAYLPGRIQTTLRHPMLSATKLWATAHLLANGAWADVLLFGSILAWAVLDRISLKRRTPRPVPGAPPSGANDAIAVGAGLALYAGFLFGLHRMLIGVSPLP